MRALLLALVALVAIHGVAGAASETAYHWYANGRAFPLYHDPTRLVVAVDDVPAALKRPEIASLNGQPFGSPTRRLLLLTGVAEFDATVRDLTARDDVRFIAPYMEPAPGTTPQVPLPVICLGLRKGARPTSELKNFLSEFGTLEKLGNAQGSYTLKLSDPEPFASLELAGTLAAERPEIAWAHPDFLVRRTTRGATNDPHYALQWHLENTGQGAGVVDIDIDAPTAWDLTIGSTDVKIAIIDTGVTDHEDLRPNMLPGRDVMDDDDDPSPFDMHGTNCAGAAAGRGNNAIGIAGVAYNSSIIPIRLVDGIQTITDEVEAFQWAFDLNADIASNSWGPDDRLGIPQPLPDSVRAEIDHCFDYGRGGKGMVIFWAAGNGHPVDTCDDDGYAAYDRVICVGAHSNFGERSWFSESCTAMDFSAPSSGGSQSIVTTSANDGYSFGFGGTSAACPLAAGVGALLLSCNPDLNVAQVYAALAAGAVKIDPANGGYDGNGFSTIYGYGAINARASLERVGPCEVLPPTPTPTFTPVPKDLPYVEGFEDGLEDWEASGTALWETGAPSNTGPATAFEGAACLGTVIDGSYDEDLAFTSLTSPTINLRNAVTPQLRMEHWYQSDGPLAALDGGAVFVSTEGTRTFTPLEPVGGYPESWVSGAGGPGFAYAMQPQWETVIFDLSAYAGQVIQIRFRFGSDARNSDYPGWYIDNVRVGEAPATPTPTPTPTPTATPQATATPLPGTVAVLGGYLDSNLHTEGEVTMTLGAFVHWRGPGPGQRLPIYFVGLETLVALYDDGRSNGDDFAGDRFYTFETILPAGMLPGTWLLEIPAQSGRGSTTWPYLSVGP